MKNHIQCVLVLNLNIFFLNIVLYHLKPSMLLDTLIGVWKKDRHILVNKRLPFVDRCEVTTIVKDLIVQ